MRVLKLWRLHRAVMPRCVCSPHSESVFLLSVAYDKRLLSVLFGRLGVEWSAGPTPRHTSTMASGKLACVVVLWCHPSAGVFFGLEWLP